MCVSEEEEEGEEKNKRRREKSCVAALSGRHSFRNKIKRKAKGVWKKRREVASSISHLSLTHRWGYVTEPE